jgi:preprotein translocase subunit YajC
MHLLGPFVTFALGAPAQSGQGGPPAWMNLPVLAAMGVALYFGLIRPQQKKAKQHAELLKAVRPGDKIITSGGIIGVVTSVKEKSLAIRSADAKMEVTKSAIAEITERAGSSAEVSSIA